MFYMGYYCKRGLGTEQDLKAAVSWYQKAVHAG